MNGSVQTARQAFTQVNDVATQLGDRAQTSSPLITALSQRVDTKLDPVLENGRTTAVAIHDAVLKRMPSIMMSWSRASEDRWLLNWSLPSRPIGAAKAAFC